MVVSQWPGSHASRRPWTTLCCKGRRVSTFSSIGPCVCVHGTSGSFTAEYPLEVDDEFWENDDPQLAFRQPPDKPSTVAAFNLWLRLTDFAASALHRFVSCMFCRSFHSFIPMSKGYYRARRSYFWFSHGGYFEPIERELDGVGRESTPTLYAVIGPYHSQ